MLLRMDRLILGEIAGLFLFGVLLFTSLLFAGGEVLRFAEFLGMGVPVATAGRYLLLTLPFILAFTFPMAMLLAALLGFGRLSNDSEIVALLAAGASFGRIVVPVGAFALGVSLLGLWFNDSVVPAANRGRHAILDQVRQEGGVPGSTRPFTIPIREKGMLTTLVHVEGGVDLTDRSLRNVSIQTWHQGRKTGDVFAERAVWEFGTRQWQLFDFEGWFRQGENTATFRGKSGRTVEMGTPQELAAVPGRVEDATIRDLLRRVQGDRARGDESRAREAEVEVARRVALPFASFVFALVGAPLGVRPQRAGGKGVGFGLAILIIFLYWTALQFVSYLGQSGALPPAVALSLPNIVGVIAAVYLIRRVLR